MLSGMTSEYGQGGQENIKKDLIFKTKLPESQTSL